MSFACGFGVVIWHSLALIFLGLKCNVYNGFAEGFVATIISIIIVESTFNIPEKIVERARKKRVYPKDFRLYLNSVIEHKNINKYFIRL